jgi:hypothetical protein
MTNPTKDFIVVWGRDHNAPKARPYSTYTAKDGRPLAFDSANLWFADCPTITTLEDLEDVLSRDPHQEVVILLEDAFRLFGWTDFATTEDL